MNCPRCQASSLSERDRDGILVDVCATCRGVWLDRGELEKLLARATRETEELAPRRDAAPPHGVRDADDDGDGAEDHRGPRTKRRWFDALGDLFD